MLNYRWTIDYPEDVDFLRALYAVLPPEPPIIGMDEVLAALKAHPEIAAINRGRHAHVHDPDSFPLHDMARPQARVAGEPQLK
jgi:hypothetical protein